jgi:hypothetical protein
VFDDLSISMEDEIRKLYDNLVYHNLVDSISISSDEERVKVVVDFPQPPDDEMISSMNNDLEDIGDPDWNLRQGVERSNDGYVAYFFRSDR